jgi:hypothetical protein
MPPPDDESAVEHDAEEAETVPEAANPKPKNAEKNAEKSLDKSKTRRIC